VNAKGKKVRLHLVVDARHLLASSLVGAPVALELQVLAYEHLLTARDDSSMHPRRRDSMRLRS